MQTTTDGKATLNNDAAKTATHYAESLFPEQQHDYVFEKMAIVGCGYVGMALARYWDRRCGLEYRKRVMRLLQPRR